MIGGVKVNSVVVKTSSLPAKTGFDSGLDCLFASGSTCKMAQEEGERIGDDLLQTILRMVFLHLEEKLARFLEDVFKKMDEKLTGLQKETFDSKEEMYTMMENFRKEIEFSYAQVEHVLNSNLEAMASLETQVRGMRIVMPEPPVIKKIKA